MDIDGGGEAHLAGGEVGAVHAAPLGVVAHHPGILDDLLELVELVVVFIFFFHWEGRGIRREGGGGPLHITMLIHVFVLTIYLLLWWSVTMVGEKCE